MIYAAITAALAAGDRLRHAFGSELRVTEEFAHDIKIAADKECQDLIYRILADEGLAGEIELRSSCNARSAQRA